MSIHPQREGIFLEVGVGANDFCVSPAPLIGEDSQVTPLDFSQQSNNRYIGIDMPTVKGRSYRDQWGSGFFDWMRESTQNIDEETREDSAQIARNFNEIEALVRKFRPLDRINFLVTDAERLPFEDGAVSEVYMANVLGSMIHGAYAGRLLVEAKRVLGDDGRLTIRENVTPLHAKGFEQKIADAGFSGDLQTYKFGTPEYDEMVSQYGISHADMGYYDHLHGEDERFFAVADTK